MCSRAGYSQGCAASDTQVVKQIDDTDQCGSIVRRSVGNASGLR